MNKGTHYFPLGTTVSARGFQGCRKDRLPIVFAGREKDSIKISCRVNIHRAVPEAEVPRGTQRPV